MVNHPLAHRSGLTMMGWLLAAYDEWGTLTKAQRLALTTREGRPIVFRRLELRELWKDGQPTLWGEFVVDARRQEALNRYTVNDAGDLCKVAQLEDWRNE